MGGGADVYVGGEGRERGGGGDVCVLGVKEGEREYMLGEREGDVCVRERGGVVRGEGGECVC